MSRSAPKPPNAVEFGLLADVQKLTDSELAATYGVDRLQIKAWKKELAETGMLADASTMPRSRSETVRRIIDGCLDTILTVAEMSHAGMSPAEKIKHMEACSNVLARVQPYVAPEAEPIVIDEHDAWQMVERASRSADVVLH